MEAEERFVRSAFIKRLWPESLRNATLPYFAIQDALNVYMNNRAASVDLYIPYLHRLLTKTPLKTPVAWFLGSNADQEKLLESAPPAEMTSPTVEYLLGVRAFSERNYAGAIEPLKQAEELPTRRQEIFRYRIYALCMAGQIKQAQRLSQERLTEFAKEKKARPESPPALPPFWQWMKKTFGIDPIAGMG